jgi:protease-4
MSENKQSMNPLAVILLLSAGFFVVFLILSGVFVALKGSGSMPRASVATSFLGSSGGVGVVEISGVILDSKKTLARLRRFEEDNQVSAVVLRLNSPGGSVAPSQEIYEAVQNYKKPLVVSMASVAASGAYYIACGAKKVYANAGTLTGSIGVIMPFANLQKLYEWAKVQRYSIKTGKYKDAGADYREMTADERALLQTMLDDVLMQFKQAVAKGRGLSMEAVTKVADGRIFSGQQAKAFHLVDELGTLQDAIQEAGVLAKIKGKPTVIYPEKKRRGLLDFVLDDPLGNDEEAEAHYAQGDVVSRVFRHLEGLVQGRTQPTASFAPTLEPALYWLWQ